MIVNVSTKRIIGDITATNIYKSFIHKSSWWRGTVVERRSLAGELSLSCA